MQLGRGGRGGRVGGGGSEEEATTASSRIGRCSLFMFMFRPRRNALIKRLWRSAAARASRTDQQDQQQQQQQQQPLTQQVSSSGGGGGANWQRATVLKAATHALLKRLSDDQLAALVDAVDSAGAAPSPCLHLDAETVNSNLPTPLSI